MTKDEFIAELSDKYYKPLYVYIANNCSDKNMIEDIIQDTFTIAYKKADTLYSHPHILPWLYRTARFCILRTVEEVLYLEDLREIAELLEKEDHFEENCIRALDLYPEITKHITPEELRLIIQHFEEGYEFTELAEENHVSVDAIKMKISRIKKRLRKKLEGKFA